MSILFRGIWIPTPIYKLVPILYVISGLIFMNVGTGWIHLVSFFAGLIIAGCGMFLLFLRSSITSLDMTY